MPLCAECKASACWTERTKLEKWLIPSLILIGALALALVLTCFYLAGWFTKSNVKGSPTINEGDKKSDFQKKSETISSNDDNVCSTPSCISAAKRILENMDPSVSPCENFYDFACGNFIKKKIIPEGQSFIESFSILGDEIKKKMKIAFEEPLQEGEPKVFQLMKRFYKICMDMNTIEKNGLNTIRSILKDLGGWPILEGNNWEEDKFDWKELSHKFQNIGYKDNPLIKVYIFADFKNSSRHTLIIADKKDSIHPTTFSMRLWTKEELLKAYFQHMVDVAVLLGADKNKSAKEIKDMHDFHVKLSSLPTQGKDGEEMTVNQLQNKIPNISWVNYINKILGPHMKISGDEGILVFELEYLKSVASLLPTVSKRTIANYMMWNFVYFSAPYSIKALREANLKFDKIKTGIAIQPARWIVCVENTREGSLSIGAGALFVRKYFNNKTKQDAHEMFLNIHHSLQDTMKNIDWMDATTKKNALDKLKAMIIWTAYPEELLDDKKLEEYYGDLNLDENDYLKSFLKLNQFNNRNYYRGLRKPVVRGDWVITGDDVTDVGAANSPTLNVIGTPAGILQDPFFDRNRPHYLNYGAIGYVIGHEYTHGFDNLGSKHDKYGNEADWWTSETKNVFKKKAQCFVEQFNKYVVPDLNMTINGELTLKETIADGGGIAVSYKAYQELIEKQGCDKTLPGLNYTQNQLFWIAAANCYCSKQKIERLLSSLSNTHPPNRYRVMGFVSNNIEFSKDFRCSSKSKMNPKNKCKLW